MMENAVSMGGPEALTPALSSETRMLSHKLQIQDHSSHFPMSLCPHPCLAYSSICAEETPGDLLSCVQNTGFPEAKAVKQTAWLHTPTTGHRGCGRRTYCLGRDLGAGRCGPSPEGEEGGEFQAKHLRCGPRHQEPRGRRLG